MTCTAKAVNAFGFAAAHEYVKVQGCYDDDDDREMMTAIDMSVCQANFAEESKAQADAMVEDLRAAFKELVGQEAFTQWMDLMNGFLIKILLFEDLGNFFVPVS